MNRYAILFLLVLCRCGARREERETPLVEDETPFIMLLLVDMSGSFEYLMADDGKAYEFTMNLLETHFRDRMGEEDKIIIAQIGGTDRSLIWQGTPMELRKDFAHAAAFRDFLKKKSIGSSNIHYSITQSVEYLMSERNVQNGKAKTAVFVLSDMMDTDENQEESRKKAIDTLTAYGKIGGCVGFYYVDQLLLPGWRHDLQAAGLKDWRCEGDFVGRPNLPSFD